MKRHPGAIPAQAAHHYAVRIYYEDSDAGGVVYHANYLRYAERARTEALREAGIPHAEMVQQHGLMFVVRRVEVEYLRPARVDDLLAVTTEPLAVGGASVRLRQRVLRGDELLAVLELRLACVAVADGRPGRLPDRWRQALERQIAADAAS
jgi:acyl-CoA thioester hydrolase